MENARDISERLNKNDEEKYELQETLIQEETTKISDLQEPTKKMSKSSENQKGVIRLLDEPEVIRKKIMSATTDSLGEIKIDKENQPGITNLINIYSSVNEVTPKEVEEKFKTYRYGDFKKEVEKGSLEK